MSAMTSGERPAHWGHIVVGLCVMLIGLGLLLDRFNLAWHIHLSTRLWPLIPLGIGLYRMANVRPRPDGRPRRSGMWLVFIGGWGLLNEFHVFGLDYGSSWPLIVVFAGTLIVRGAIARPSPDSRHRRSTE